MALHHELKKARRKQKQTQKELATRIGVVHTTISLYESGDRLPSLPALIQLSSALDVSLDQLLREEIQNTKR